MKRFIKVIIYLHENNIVHRDIKLENILLKEKKDDLDFYLADFGLASRLDSESPVL